MMYFKKRKVTWPVRSKEIPVWDTPKSHLFGIDEMGCLVASPDRHPQHRKTRDAHKKED